MPTQHSKARKREREREKLPAPRVGYDIPDTKKFHCEQHTCEIGKDIANISCVTVHFEEFLLPVHSRHGRQHRVRKREKGLQT